MKKILLKFPSRSRPQKLFATLDNIYSMCESEEDLSVMLTLDVDDSTCNTAEVRDGIASYGIGVVAHWGFRKSKIEACNADMEFAPDFDILVLVSDDFVFIEKGFDNIIRADFEKYFPDLDGVLHYPDGSPAHDKLITMSIMGEPYYRRFNYLYEPSYASVYVDNEFTEVSKKLGRYKFIDRQIAEHRHPAWRKCEVDDLYRRNEDPVLYAADHKNYLKRKKMNFGL